DAAGHADEAERQYALVEYMGKVAAAVGTTYGRQLALFYADHDRRPEEALRLARLEAAGRGDIYTDDTLAWACYKNGRLAEAARAAHRALRLGTEDAMLHYHAGTIAAALGHGPIAARHLRRAPGLNPHFDLRQAPRARARGAGAKPRAHRRRHGGHARAARAEPRAAGGGGRAADAPPRGLLDRPAARASRRARVSRPELRRAGRLAGGGRRRGRGPG